MVIFAVQQSVPMTFYQHEHERTVLRFYSLLYTVYRCNIASDFIYFGFFGLTQRGISCYSSAFLLPLNAARKSDTTAARTSDSCCSSCSLYQQGYEVAAASVLCQSDKSMSLSHSITATTFAYLVKTKGDMHQFEDSGSSDPSACDLTIYYVDSKLSASLS